MAHPNAHLIPSRLAKRASFDTQTIHHILDEALFCTVSYVLDGQPMAIPTAFVRYQSKIYIHGSVGSHFIRAIEEGAPVCITITLMDALVVAKSAFHHSVNYRSVVLFSKAEKITDENLKIEAFQWLTNKMVPNSWDYLRPIKANEVIKTTILAFDISEASAKIRSGMPVNDEEDNLLPIWSGLIPLETIRRSPVSDDQSAAIKLPPHLNI
jgi:nitroimidazol reductase NimA-like FMN-containing flavoprotein (pyridoxamine 5'-phosphate oxidase superfamily)